MSDVNVVWEATVDDDKYHCQVLREDENFGRLVLTEQDTKKILLDKKVGLSYGAQFGPDTYDVQEWQDLAVAAIDNQS